MRHTKIRIYKGTAAACVAAVALSAAAVPNAVAQEAPPPPPAVEAPQNPAPPAPAPGAVPPPPALAALPPAPTPEQIHTSILQIIDLSRTAIAVTAEGLRIAFEALNAAEQAVVAADNNYLIAESEHGADSPEAVAAGAQKDLTESKVETAGLKGDQEAASVATPESAERREAASVAPALKDAPKTDAAEKSSKDDAPAPTTDMGKAIQDVRDKQEAYTTAAQAERDLLKRTDANPATVQELRDAAEKTRIAEEELTASINELEKVAGKDEKAPAPAGAEKSAAPKADTAKSDTKADTIPVKDSTDKNSGSSTSTSKAATTTTTEAADKEDTAGKADGAEVTDPAPEVGEEPAAPSAEPSASDTEATAGIFDAPKTSGADGAMAPQTDTPPAPDNNPADAPKEDTPPEPPKEDAPKEDKAPAGSEEEAEKFNKILGGPDGLYAKEATTTARANAAAAAMDQYANIGPRGDVKDFAPFWEFLAKDADAAKVVGDAIGTPLGDSARQSHSGPSKGEGGGGSNILTTPATKGCVKKEPGNVNNVGYGNYHCKKIFLDGPDAVKARVNEWAALKSKPNNDPKKKEFLEKYVTEKTQNVTGKSEDSRRIAILDEMVAMHAMVGKTAGEKDKAVKARSEVTGKLDAAGLRPIPNAAGKGEDKVVEPKK